MKRVLFTILIVAALVGLVVTPASTVMAAASATRGLPSSAVAGADFDIDISIAEYGAFGQVVETLPDGFSYVGCDDLSEAAVDVGDGQVVTFTLLEEDTAFSYTVKASSTAGTYPFSGTLKDVDKVSYDVGGDTEIMVPASRSLPSSVTAGGNFDVDINTFDYGAFGQVVETLPDGFSYVGCDDLSEAAVDVDGQVVTFTLLGETVFTYTVKASSTAGTYPFSGILKDVDKVEYAIGGDTQITVTRRSGGGGGGGAPTYNTETNLFGVEKSYRIDSDGEILAAIEATSADGLLTMTIPKGTIALGKDGKRLKSLQTAVDESPPDPAEDTHIIGLAYDFGPDGATFDPEITLVWSYDPDALPEDVAEEGLVVAYYAGEWVEVDCVVDTENDTITASVEHFTTFAIIGAVTPPEEEEVAPPEEEEVAPPVEVPVKPAVFTTSSLSISPTEADIEQSVTISVLVANTGDVTGSYEVTLKINNVAVATQDVTLAGGASQTVTFTTAKDAAGTYTVNIDGLSGTLVVKAPPVEVPAPINWPLIGGIIAAVVVIALIIFFLVRRR